MKPLQLIKLSAIAGICMLALSCKKSTQNPSSTGALGSGFQGGPSGPGLNTQVNTLIVYNGNLIAGGEFTAATGATNAQYIAQWNGSVWSGLGSGMNGPVNALTIYNGNLVAAGNFSTAGGKAVNNIAMWNGTSWQAIGSGFDHAINALCVYNGTLIAGGVFDTLNGGTANYIAQWNGTAWVPVGQTMKYLQSATPSLEINALTVYNGTLIAGGSFYLAGEIWANGIAQWDGTQWSLLGSGTGTIVYSLGTYNGNLFAGGTFTASTGNYISQWNGTVWSTVDSNAIHTGYAGGPVVLTLTNYNGSLVAGGQFYSLASGNATGLGQWDGSTWSTPFGTGIRYNPPYSSGYTVIYASAVYNNNLIIGGYFTQATNTLGTNYIAQWDCSKWSAL